MQEVREPATYNAIIQAVATGSMKISPIATQTELGVSACAAFLKNLIGFGIVCKKHPLGESKRGVSARCQKKAFEDARVRLVDFPRMMMPQEA